MKFPELKIENFKLKEACPAKLERSKMRSGGFTILESIIAIFILSLSISGVFSSVQQSLSQATIAKDETKAFYLAEEAMEILRNKRDANQLARILNSSTNTWLFGIAEGVGDPCYFGNVCRVDAVTASFVRCGVGWNSCSNLRQNSSTFLYGYDGSWPATNFKREVILESISATEVAVTVRITWTKGLINREFKAKTHLFNWI